MVNSDACTGMMPSGMILALVSGHNGYFGVVIPANETLVFKPEQESERTSTDNTTNTSEGKGILGEITKHIKGFFIPQAVIVHVRQFVIREVAGQALLFVVTAGNMPVHVLFEVLKKIAIDYDTTLHQSKNMDEDAFNGIPIVIMREIICRTICPQLYLRAGVSAACRISCQLALNGVFPPVTSTVSS